MELKNIFTQEFVSTVKKILAEKCKDGSACKRSELVAALKEEFNFSNVDEDDFGEHILKVSIDLGVFDSDNTKYGNFKGRYGGVCEVDLDATARLEANYQKKLKNMEKARQARSEKAAQARALREQEKARKEQIAEMRRQNMAKAREARKTKLAEVK